MRGWWKGSILATENVLEIHRIEEQYIGGRGICQQAFPLSISTRVERKRDTVASALGASRRFPKSRLLFILTTRFHPVTE
jgi:hypothetical protein